MSLEEGGMNLPTGSMSNTVIKKKMRGPGRPTLSLGGRKKLEKATRKKERRRVNRQLGRAGINKDSLKPAGRKKAITKKQEQVPTLSVLFLEQTQGGALAKRLQQAELELGMKTGFRMRVVENAGTALKRVFSSTNPWGSKECGRPDCVV